MRACARAAGRCLSLLVCADGVPARRAESVAQTLRAAPAHRMLAELLVCGDAVFRGAAAQVAAELSASSAGSDLADLFRDLGITAALSRLIQVERVGTVLELALLALANLSATGASRARRALRAESLRRRVRCGVVRAQ